MGKEKMKKEEVKEEVFEEDFLLDIQDETEVYAIKLFNNRKRPEEKQMRVHIKPFSGKDLSNIASQIRAEIRRFQQENPDDEREFIDLYNMFSDRFEFMHRIVKMENFRYKENGEENEITSPDQLFDFKNSKFALITNELRQKFMEIDFLNSKNL